MTESISCTSATILLVLAILAGIVSNILFVMIITIPVAIGVLAFSILCAIISIYLIGKALYKHGFWKLSNWCKINVIICIIIIIGQIVRASVTRI